MPTVLITGLRTPHRSYLLLLLFWCTAFTAVSQTDLDFMMREDIRGKVRKVLQATAIVPPGQSPWQMNTAIPLDFQMIEFTAQGEYKSRKVYISEQGYLLLSKQFGHNAKGKPLSADVRMNGNRLISTFQLSYDSLGRLAEMIVAGADGKTRTQQLQYTYQENRTEVRHQFFAPAPKTLLHVVVDHQWVETRSYDSLGIPVEITERKYNQQGFVSEITTRDTTGRTTGGASFEYELDSQGNWTRRLSRDWATDEYTLTLQTVVYDLEKDRKPSLKELQGYWVSPLGKINLKVTDKEAGLEIEPEFLVAKNINYNQTSGQFSLQNRFGAPIDFTATYDGKILTLVSNHKNATYFLKRVDTTTMSTAERYKFEYAQILPNPQLENFTEYDQLNFVSGRLLSAKKGNRYGLLDVRGNIVAPFVYDEIVAETGKKITALHNDISRHKAVVLFIKNGDFGYLNGFGQEIKPVPTPLTGNQSGFKTFELPGLLSFAYPSSWQRINNNLNMGEKSGYASISVSNIAYTGDFREWLKNRPGNSEWQIEMISGTQVFHKTEKKTGFIGLNEQEGYFQEVFVELNGQSAVQIALKANVANYPKLAQEFYNLRHTIQLLR